MYSLLVLISVLISCDSVTIRYETQDAAIAAKTKVELSPIHINCDLYDMIILSAPAVNSKEVVYNLHKPNGEVFKLDFKKSKRKSNREKQYQLPEYDPIVVKYISKDVRTVYPDRNFKVINTNYRFRGNDIDIVNEEEKGMKANDFMIGPVSEEYHGNWVLSVYCKDIDEYWIELFQVITINIIVTVPMNQRLARLNKGDTFKLSFAYPIEDLQSCELTAPRSTFDRFFDRSRIELDKCGYVIKNVTLDDHGIWKVVGVGKIVYEGAVHLVVKP